MTAPFQCSCGVKTREPFYINGEMLCTLCVERISPRLVTKRAEKNWFEFTQANRVVPTRPGYRARWRDADDD